MELMAEQMKTLGIEALVADERLEHERPLLSVEVQVKLHQDPKLDPLRFTRKTKRGSLMHYHGFRFDPETQVLKFLISTEVPLSYQATYGKLLLDDSLPITAMIFTDFCWVYSEGTTDRTILEVTTPVAEWAVLGDLTWLLPSKFADDLIESVHAMNEGILSGIMANAILYGPFFFVNLPAQLSAVSRAVSINQRGH